MIPAPYDWISVVAAAPFVGSFLSVLITRLPRHQDVVFRPSHCPHCDHALGVRDLVPVASYVANSGACRFCGGSISRLYPTIEIAALAIAAWAAIVVDGELLWITCLLGWSLLTLSVMDAREMVLSDRLTLPLIGAGFVVTALFEPSRISQHVIGALAGLLIIVTVSRVYSFARGVEGLGLGDAKLLAASGAWLAWEALGGVLLVGAVATLGFAIAARVLGGKLTNSTAVPFGPGLALGFWLSWLYGPVVLT